MFECIMLVSDCRYGRFTVGLWYFKDKNLTLLKGTQRHAKVREYPQRAVRIPHAVLPAYPSAWGAVRIFRV